MTKAYISRLNISGEIYMHICKVRWSRYRPSGWVEVQLYSSMNAALEGGEWSAARPGRTLPPGKTLYPFYRWLGGPQGRSGWAENLIPIGIWSQTVQPVISCYTDWATWHMHIGANINNGIRWCGHILKTEQRKKSQNFVHESKQMIPKRQWYMKMLQNIMKDIMQRKQKSFWTRHTDYRLVADKHQS